MELRVSMSEEEPENSDSGPFLSVIEQDMVRKVNAGTRLLFALYHSPPELFKHAPQGLISAYIQAHKAWGLDREST
ncbi:MAG: hypothetical protein M3N52_12055 [Actinomycetota bacterium]|nr:hypothetical protein [Actinomycetota bacterium]